MSQPHPTPGILLVHGTPSPQNPTHFHLFTSWTKLHFRDLLSIPASPQGKITSCLRFTNPDTSSSSSSSSFSSPSTSTSTSHSNSPIPTSSPTKPHIIHTCHFTNLSLAQAQSFENISKQLDLENVRPLARGEEPVLRNPASDPPPGTMIWDVATTLFGVYNAIPFPDWLAKDLKMKDQEARYTVRDFQTFVPKSMQSMHMEASVLVNIYIRISVAETSAPDTGIAPDSPLLDILPGILRPATKLKRADTAVEVSLYRYAGAEKQVPGYPLILGLDDEGVENWLICMRVGEWGERVDEERVKGLVMDGLLDVGFRDVEEGLVMSESKNGVQVGFGVWKGEILMGDKAEGL